MEGLLLPIFPDGSLASSVVTTVWVGVFIVVFFNLRLGWVMSGLVVPGYLAPIVLLKPWSAAVIVFEAAVTYLIVYLASEKLSRTGLWSSFFGRDRFFALILTAVGVRVLFDGFLLPGLVAWLETQGAGDIAWRNDLQSFGLVILALIANMFWKPGLWRGLRALAVILGLTVLITRYVLMEYTNFALSNIGYMYEDVAQSLLASPKSYIILLTAAFIASRMNLRYGWDFNGILLPSLLALQWYQPSKIAFTLVEAAVIVTLARLLLRSPWLANANIEGSRKLLLLFNISFAYRFVLAWVLALFAPEYKISDAYGYGYLLATLIALRIFDKGKPLTIVGSTLQASLAAVLLASVIGFGLQFGGPLTQTATLAARPLSPRLAADPGPLDERLRADKPQLYAIRSQRRLSLPGVSEQRAFREAIGLLDGPDALDPGTLQAASLMAARAGYELLVVDGRWLYLREIEPARGWGIFVIDTQAPSPLALVWPTGADHREGLDLALASMKLLPARYFAYATAPSRLNPDGSASALQQPAALLNIFQDSVASGELLQVRVLDATLQARLQRERGVGSEDRNPPSSLWVDGHLPAALPLRRLQQVLPGLQTYWDAPPYANPQRGQARDGFAELLLSRAAFRRFLGASIGGGEVAALSTAQRVEGFLAQWLFAPEERFAARGSGNYSAPSLEELLYAEEELLRPLLELAPSAQARESEALDRLDAVAQSLGYRITRLQQVASGEHYLILSEPPGSRRHWGLLILRTGPASDVLLQVPRPLSEAGSAEFAISLFEDMQARGLFVSTAHPRAAVDGSADPMLPAGRQSLFNLSAETFLRTRAERPALLLHVRGKGVAPELYEDLGGAPSEALVVADRQPPGPLARAVHAALDDYGIEHVDAYSAADAASLGVDSSLQARVAQPFPQAEFVALRLSPSTRAAFRRSTSNRVELMHFQALDIPSQDIPLRDYLAGRGLRGGAPVPPELAGALADYQLRPDIVALERARRAVPGYRFLRIADPRSVQTFLVVQGPEGRLGGVWNLNPLRQRGGEIVSLSALDAPRIERFTDRGEPWLRFDP